CRILRTGRVFRCTRADTMGRVALAWHSRCRAGRGHSRPHRGHSDFPPARPLFRPCHARVPARAALRLRVAGLPGTGVADATRPSRCLHAVRGSPHLRLAGAGADDRRDGADQPGGTLALRHVAGCDPRRRGRGGGRGHSHAGVEVEGDQLSGALAGAAGGFYAVVLLVVTPPAVFGMLVSTQALIVAMFGGVATLWGPVI